MIDRDRGAAKGLVERLDFLSRNHIIALNHGRLVPEVETPQAVTALKRVFKQQYVDVYTCTFGELWSLSHYPHRTEAPESADRSDATLADLARQLALPPITVVRGEDWPGDHKVYLILDGEVQVVEEDDGELAYNPGAAGHKSGLNAAFLYSLAREAVPADLAQKVVQAARFALRASMP